jgi:hypothetical protein
VATFSDTKSKPSGRLPLILVGVFVVAGFVAALFVGDLGKLQETVIADEGRAVLREVNDPGQLDQALKQHPANRILKLVGLATEEAAEFDAVTRKLLNEAEPAASAKPVNLTVASRSDLEALRRDLKTAENNAAALKPRMAALIKTRRAAIESRARALGVESNTMARFMAAIDEQHAEAMVLAAKMLAARAEYYGAYDKCVALLLREFGSYRVANGQFVFRLQPTADSYNAAANAMAAAPKRMAELEEERTAQKQSQLNRWKMIVER